MSKQPYNEIDTECLDYIVNELKNNRSMQQMLNYYKGKYYSDRYWELKKQVDKAIKYIENENYKEENICIINGVKILNILRGNEPIKKED